MPQTVGAVMLPASPQTSWSWDDRIQEMSEPVHFSPSQTCRIAYYIFIPIVARLPLARYKYALPVATQYTGMLGGSSQSEPARAAAGTAMQATVLQGPSRRWQLSVQRVSLALVCLHLNPGE